MGLFTLITGFAMAILSNTGDSMLFEENVLRIEGELYTVHHTVDHEVRFQVDKTTHLEGGAFRVGDKLEPT